MVHVMAEQLKWALQMFDNHPDPMVVSRIRDGRIDKVNAAFLRLFGYNQTEVIDKSSLDLSMIEKADRQESIHLLKKQGYVRDKNVSIRTKNGEIRSASLTVVEIEDHDDPRMLTIIHDVTELKQIKERLAHDQGIIQHLIDNIPVLLTIWDPKLQQFTLNRHAESVLGWTTADANSGDFMSKVYPDPAYRSEVASFMQSLSPEWHEWNVTAKDGSIIPTSWTNTCLSDETMIGIGLDLRERNRILNVLWENEDNFRIALAHSKFVPAQFDRDLRYRWIYNPHPDFDPSFVIGKRDDELDDSQSTKRLRTMKQQVIETGKGVREEIAFDRSDGTHWYDVIIEPLRDAGGEITGGTSAAYDITMQKLAEGALRQLNETLEKQVDERTKIAESRAKLLQSLAAELIQAEESERQRIANFLHEDLQQIISSARMQINTAFDNPDPSSILEKVEQLLGDSLEKSQHLSHELSPPVLHQFGLAAALEWLVRHMDEKFGLKVWLESKLTSKIKDATVKVFLFRAVQELLFNVVKHSGGDIDTAEVYLNDADNIITLSVSDQGKGFDPAILDSVTRESGIGLLSLRERATAIGGNLDIKSAPGRGSRFTITAPISLGTISEPEKLVQDTVSPSGIRKKKAVDGDSEIIRVLLVDDHKVIRQGLVSIIAAQPGITVAGEAGSGEEALELARQLKPDVIIMDISMAGMGGVEATRVIKTENPEIRVIGLSMFAEENISQKMREAGADGFVSKSESSSVLLKAIYDVAE